MAGGTKPTYIQWLRVIIVVGMSGGLSIAFRADTWVFQMPSHHVPRPLLFLILTPVIPHILGNLDWIGLSPFAMRLYILSQQLISTLRVLPSSPSICTHAHFALTKVTISRCTAPIVFSQLLMLTALLAYLRHQKGISVSEGSMGVTLSFF